MAATGCGLLLARPWLAGGWPDPVPFLIVLFAAVGVAGALWPQPQPLPGTRFDGPVTPLAPVAALVVGVAAFGVGRMTIATPGPVGPGSALAVALALNSLAAVAEEALFRRHIYGWLLRHGPAVAIAGSAAAFAIVHVTVWGWWVLPLDLAAGLVLSWQRHASGGWTVPALTHVAANAWALT